MASLASLAARAETLSTMLSACTTPATIGVAGIAWLYSGIGDNGRANKESAAMISLRLRDGLIDTRGDTWMIRG